jgi:hypothetical protein
MFGAQQGQFVQISATRFPPCGCGRAFGDHVVTGVCSGYAPKGEPADLGIRAFHPSASWPVWKQAVTWAYWQVEKWAKVRRERLTG